MITLNFITSPDSTIIGERTFYKKTISIGRHWDNDIIIDDPNLFSKHLIIRNKENGVLCSSNIEVPFYHSNKKRIKGDRLHKVNDEVKIGDTTFIIKIHSPVSQISISEDVQKKWDQLEEEDSPIRYLIEDLQDELYRIDQDINE